MHMMLVDVGASMDVSFSEGGGTRLHISLECVKLTLQQKLFHNPSHELGFCVFGDDQQQELMVLHPLSRPDLDLVRKIEQMSSMQLGNRTPGGDILRALITVCTMLREKKGVKRLFVFTNGEGDTHCGREDVIRLADLIRGSDIKLNIIAIDFMNSYDIESNSVGEQQMSDNQRRNGELLTMLKDREQDNVQIFTAFLAIELYKKFRVKEMNPVVIYRGPLQIAPGLQIQCQTYKAVRREKTRPLQKYIISETFEPQIATQKQVLIETNYYNDQSRTPISKEEQVNAYSYGPHLIPMNHALEKNAKNSEEKNFRLLGFVPSHLIPRYSFMSEVDIVVPTGSNRNLFTALTHSMLTLSSYAIARYVPRHSSTPRLMALIPSLTAEMNCMYAVELPTVQDVRDFPFRSLKHANERQQEAVRQLIDSLTLSDASVSQVFNYMRQYLYQVVYHKASQYNNCDLPPIDERIRSFMQEEYNKEVEKSVLKAILAEFKFTLCAAKTTKDSTIVKWKELLDSTIGDISVSSHQQPIKKPFSFHEDKQFNHMDPIKSFRSMLNDNEIDLVACAMKCMRDFIFAKLECKQDRNEILNLVKELRMGCIEQKEQEYWDMFLEDFLRVGWQYCQLIRDEGLGYIKRSNKDLFKTDTLHIVEMVFDDLD